MGFFNDLVSDPIGTIGNVGQSVINTVKDHPLEAAALGAAGYYFAPQIGAWFSPTTGEAVAGTAAGSTAGAATSALTTAQLAKLGLTAASLLAGGKALSNVGGGSTGGLMAGTQDRSGFTSGSANYSPEYYAAIQSKYNQYMPTQAGKDITTDLKNWYETKYTPSATSTPTTTTTGTGYTTPTTLANLNIPKQTVAPLYTALKQTSTDADIANAFTQFINQNGGNTTTNRQAAIDYLTQLGVPSTTITAAYNKYLSSLPTSGTTSTTLTANATPSQIAQAYAGYVNQAGGDTVANRSQAITYLRNLGVPDSTIQAAYPIYQASVATPSPQTVATPVAATPTTTVSTPSTTKTTSGGLLTSSVPTPVSANTSSTASSSSAPSYTALSSSSSPADIAAAYAQFVASSGGDTQFNQQAAVNYLNNLGISNDTIGQAYGLFKGA